MADHRQLLRRLYIKEPKAVFIIGHEGETGIHFGILGVRHGNVCKVDRCDRILVINDVEGIANDIKILAIAVDVTLIDLTGVVISSTIGC